MHSAPSAQRASHRPWIVRPAPARPQAGASGAGDSGSGACRGLAARLEVVEGPGHVVRSEGEKERGHGIRPRLGVPGYVIGRHGVEVGADGDAQVRTVPTRRLEMLVELGQPGRQLLG